jgi:hypothetical protein
MKPQLHESQQRADSQCARLLSTVNRPFVGCPMKSTCRQAPCA